MPVTVGLFDFEPQDIVEAGHAWDFHSDRDAVLCSVAVFARRHFERGERAAGAGGAPF